MKGDFTRLGYDPEKHYSQVLWQQGRCDLEADRNEHTEIQTYLQRTEAEDVIGPCGVPKTGGGFEIDVGPRGRDLTIAPGRIYVDGILCELDKDLTYLSQPDYPDPPAITLPPSGKAHLVYLDVWQRHITAIEDPSIREVALGGPDTTTRLRTVWQVKVLEDVKARGCDSIQDWPPPRTGGGRLSTQLAPTDGEEHPCLMVASNGYRRLENHLYRVEVHDVDKRDVPSFKWSRDNGAVVFAIEEFVRSEPRKVKVQRLGRDEVLALHEGDWVEVLEDETELKGRPGTLTQIEEIDDTERVLTLKDDVSSHAGKGHAKVRRWDEAGDAIRVTRRSFPLGDDGIQVSYSGSGFRAGDYWTFTARAANGHIEQLTNAEPQGIRHHYCPLALLTTDPSGQLSVLSDCRRLFPAVTELTSLFYVGGDGQEALPDPTDPDKLVPLEKDLQVGVANGQWPVEGATVRFTIVEGNGQLQGTGSPVGVVTGPDGIASCRWQLDGTTQTQQVRAELLDSAENRLHMPFHFTANLSRASHVAFDAAKCLEDVKPSRTVQEALQALCQRKPGHDPYLVLRYIGGDGQEGPLNQELPCPLAVGIQDENGRPPEVPVNVVFWARSEADILTEVDEPANTGNRILVKTDEHGIAQVKWKLQGDPGCHTVDAILEEPPQESSLPIRFQALARPPEAAAPRWPAIDGISWTNDKPLRLKIFNEGLAVHFTHKMMKPAMAGPAIFLVTLELPDRVQGFPGHRPFIVHGNVRQDDEYTWRFQPDPKIPDSACEDWLEGQRSAFPESPVRIRCRVVLKGNVTLDAAGRRPLDGNAFGRLSRDGESIDLDLTRRRPSGDGIKGGDFESWFYLVL